MFAFVWIMVVVCFGVRCSLWGGGLVDWLVVVFACKFDKVWVTIVRYCWIRCFGLLLRIGFCGSGSFVTMWFLLFVGF